MKISTGCSVITLSGLKACESLTFQQQGVELGMLAGAAHFSRVFLPGRCFPDLRYHLLCLVLCSLQFWRCVSVPFSSSHLFLVWPSGYWPEYTNPALGHYKKLQSRHIFLFWKHLSFVMLKDPV